MGSKRYRNIVIRDGETGAMLNRRCELKREGLWTPLNRKQVEQDGMPKEVATEMLCRPGIRMTNRERKQYQRARQKVFTSTLEKISLADRIAIRLQSRPWEQLHRWLLRHQKRHDDVQTAFRKATVEAEKVAATPITEENKVLLAAKRVVLQRILAGLNVRGSTHQLIIDALETEIDRRKTFIDRLKQVTPSVASKVEAELCPTTGN
jgi:hypothetical protein